MRLIDADEITTNYVIPSGEDDHEIWFDKGVQLMLDEIKDAKTVDAVPVVRCKNCKHRPLHIEGYEYLQYPQLEDGSDDLTCPYACDDPYLTRMPKDDSYCSEGEAIKQ